MCEQSSTVLDQCMQTYQPSTFEIIDIHVESLKIRQVVNECNTQYVAKELSVLDYLEPVHHNAIQVLRKERAERNAGVRMQDVPQRSVAIVSDHDGCGDYDNIVVRGE